MKTYDYSKNPHRAARNKPDTCGVCAFYDILWGCKLMPFSMPPDEPMCKARRIIEAYQTANDKLRLLYNTAYAVIQTMKALDNKT